MNNRIIVNRSSSSTSSFLPSCGRRGSLRQLWLEFAVRSMPSSHCTKASAMTHQWPLTSMSPMHFTGLQHQKGPANSAAVLWSQCRQHAVVPSHSDNFCIGIGSRSIAPTDSSARDKLVLLQIKFHAHWIRTMVSENQRATVHPGAGQRMTSTPEGKWPTPSSARSWCSSGSKFQ